MPGDGNCLFAAIVYQLTELHYTHEVFQDAIFVMRQECAKHLYSCIDTYRNLIITEAIERGESWPEENRHGAIISGYLQQLSHDGVWAGSESIAAVRDILGVTIRIFSNETHPIVFEGRAGSATVNIYYNGVNHYDSVREVIELYEQQKANRVEKHPQLNNTLAATDLNKVSGLANNEIVDQEEEPRVSF